MGITILVAKLFYDSFWGLLAGFVIVPFWMKRYEKDMEQKRTSKLKTEFKEYMLLVANSLQAGYSLERALRQAEEEHVKLFSKNCLLFRPVHEMNGKIGMNIQVEKAFEEMAHAIGLEDAVNLSDILSFSKRAGGDYGRQIRQCAIKLDEKLMVNEEIETLITEKQLELKVMCVMPLGIIGYITMSSRDFIEPLYGNFPGVLLMSGCLLVYGLMIILGQKIVNIEV